MRRRRLGLVTAGLIIALAVWQLVKTHEGVEGEPGARGRQGLAELMAAGSSPTASNPGFQAHDGGGPAARKPFAFGWGSGADQLGRHTPSEGNPEAPMSLVVDAQGTAWVLDQVNKRLMRVDRNGERLPPIDLPLQAPQDLAVAKDGTVVVLDRLVDKAVAIIGPDGAPRGELKVVGKGLPEGGAATGVFIDADGKTVVVERTHGDSVRLGSLDGVADEQRGEVPGRPTKDGRAYLTASIASRPNGALLVTVIEATARAHRFTRQYALPAPIHALMLLDADAHGVVYVGATLATEPEMIAVVCLDARDGHPLGLVTLPANTSPDETFRELSVSDDGEIFMLLRTEVGAELKRARCKGS